MAKQFCKQCGIKLEDVGVRGMLNNITGKQIKQDLIPVEFEDGLYCKVCANKKRN